MPVVPAAVPPISSPFAGSSMQPRRWPYRSRWPPRYRPGRLGCLACFWVLKVVPGFRGLRQLRRVIVVESGPLFSVLVIFLMVLFLLRSPNSSLERDVQPAAFGSIPAALWWAVATLTTTGYGDVVPMTPLGRIIAACVMICGLGVFGLWTGILATGFAAETRRDNFLRNLGNREQGAVLHVPRTCHDRRRHGYAEDHRSAGAHHHYPQRRGRRLHVFHRQRRG